MNASKRQHKPDHQPTLSIRLGDLLPKHNTTVIGGSAKIVFGIPQFPVKKGRLPLIER